MLIRAVRRDDREQWLRLWQGYTAFYQFTPPDEVTRTTWERFFAADEPVHAVVAEREGRLEGLVHFIFHRNTWMVGPVCYLQDLFTSPALRGQGIGRRLIETVYAAAEAAGSPRVYWLTHETNTQAMALYDTVAERSGFVQYRKALTPASGGATR